jgi:hypothetical protein
MLMLAIRHTLALGEYLRRGVLIDRASSVSTIYHYLSKNQEAQPHTIVHFIFLSDPRRSTIDDGNENAGSGTENYDVQCLSHRSPMMTTALLSELGFLVSIRLTFGTDQIPESGLFLNLCHPFRPTLQGKG